MKNLSACTSVMVGKDASIDGSTMIARNDDTFLPLTPQRFYVKPAYKDEDMVWKSNQNGFTAKMPKSGYRFTLTPNADVKKEGVYAESGFNEKHVGMSATESTYGNEHSLAADPLVENGLAEDSLQSMVLPYIDSARDGVKYLGKLIEKYGSPEGNGVLFNDKNEVWYMEIVTGHQWVAERIPDDSYAVVANEVAIQQVDFDDPDNFMYAEGIQEFVKENHLNPDEKGFNFRHIFGTANDFDRHYNTPRVWYAQRYLNPEVEQDPMSNDLPFIRRASKKIEVTDVENILSSHYNGTIYDPLSKGNEDTKTLFRPISLNRTQNSHVLQVRNGVKDDVSTIQWMSFGVPAFSPYVPFFGNVEAEDKSYEKTPLTMDDKSAYWMYRKLSMIVESHYGKFIQQDTDYKKESNQLFIEFVDKTTREAEKVDSKDVPDFLQKQTAGLVKEMRKRTYDLMHSLMEQGLELSKLTYNMDKNL